MNPLRKTLFAAAAAGSLYFSAAVTPAFADPTSYQATGSVLAVSDTTITIMKGKEKWDMAKDANTKAAGEVKVGDKVTVHYTMTASTIDMAAAPAAKAKKGDKPAASPADKGAGTTEAQKPVTESGPAASPATTPGH